LNLPGETIELSPDPSMLVDIPHTIKSIYTLYGMSIMDLLSFRQQRKQCNKTPTWRANGAGHSFIAYWISFDLNKL
jgi:hypothetical protein